MTAPALKPGQRHVLPALLGHLDSRSVVDQLLERALTSAALAERQRSGAVPMTCNGNGALEEAHRHAVRAVLAIGQHLLELSPDDPKHYGERYVQFNDALRLARTLTRGLVNRGAS